MACDSTERWAWLGNAAPIIAAGVIACTRRHHPTVQQESPIPQEAPVEEAPVALDKKTRVAFELIGKKQLTWNTVLLRFGLPSARHVLGLPAGQHLFCYASINGETVVRAYSTITPPETKGYFEIPLKVYFAGQHPKYPLGGKMSQYLNNLEIGEKVEFKGPVGRFVYQGRGHYTRNRVSNWASHVSMIAGGSGINPLLQIIKSILDDPLDMTRISLIYANKTEQDIIFHEELDHLAHKHWNLSVYYTVEKPSWSWMQGRGLISQKMVERHLYPSGNDSILLMCGSGPMTDAMQEICTQQLDWSKDQISVF